MKLKWINWITNVPNQLIINPVKCNPNSQFDVIEAKKQDEDIKEMSTLSLSIGFICWSNLSLSYLLNELSCIQIPFEYSQIIIVSQWIVIMSYSMP